MFTSGNRAQWALALGCATLLFSSFPTIPICQAQEMVSLMETGKENQGWNFGNGPEFPGAAGGLAPDSTAKQNGRDSLKLIGDFTNGGAYVQTTHVVNGIDPRELFLWIRNPDADKFTLRLVDGTGQTHQISLRADASPDWQRVVFPVEQFFTQRGTVPNVVRYEYWGGAKDGKWHGPVSLIAVIINKPAQGKVRNFWFANLTLTAKPVEAPAPQITAPVRLDELIEGEHDWKVDLSPKSKAAITVEKDDTAPDKNSLKFAADFTKDGLYAAAIKDLQELDLRDITAVRLKLKSSNATSFAVQLVDGTGQTHQKKGFAITPDGQWHDVVIRPSEVAGGEHWGGANDGKWHGEPRRICLLLNTGSDQQGKQPAIFLTNVIADAVTAAVAQPASFKSDFEGAAQLPAGWTTAGNVAPDGQTAFKGKGSLLLSRPLAEINRPISAVSPAFDVTSGQWQFSLATKSDLKSADASYSGTVALETLDAAGKTLDQITLADIFGQHPWQPLSKETTLPPGVKSARFRVQINKAEGQFWVDDLSAAFLAPAPRKDNRVARLTFTTAVMGNLLLPTDPRTVTVSVEATKPLSEKQLQVTYEVRDYWGAEQTKPATVTVERKGKKEDRFVYEGQIDLSKAPLEIGRYYEIRGSVPRENDQPFEDFNSLAILPEAITKKYKPEEVPFTSRSWDNRIPASIQLSDRLGIRIAGIWGGWSEKPPYKAIAPSLDTAKQLGMGWLTGTPASAIERGVDKQTDESLRAGVRNLIESYGDVRPLIVNLGNEPHGTGDQVVKNVQAYKALYEEIKKTDPSITVVATSVEPNEEYFKNGYGKYCDAFDFHIYETPEGVRKTIASYRDLMKQYGTVKPIWSTELGLNSQGLPRQVVAGELYRKFATFFAAGGFNVSWFGILYPDGGGRLYGTSGEAHNVFFTRYNNYAPKLDAVAYYNAVNSIAIKKFVAEKTYADGNHAFLFRDRDNYALQIIWNDKGRGDVAIPLPGVNEVQAILIDGTRRALNAGGKAVTVSTSEDPILLAYDGGPQTLPAQLEVPAIALQSPPPMVLRGSATNVTVSLNGLPASDVDLQIPPLWTEKKTAITGADGKPAVRFSITAPEDTAARQANLIVTAGSPDKRRAELHLRPAVAGQLAMTALPAPAIGGQPAGVRLSVKNNGATAQTVNWDLSMPSEQSLSAGKFSAPTPTEAYFATAPAGSLNVEPGQTSKLTVPLAGIDPRKLYNIRAAITDATGRTVAAQRAIGGLVGVPHAKAPLKLDGSLDEADWTAAPAQELNDASQFFAVSKDAPAWKGAADLSAKLQFLWDEKYLYVGVKVTDDVAGNLQSDGMIWSQDSLQFLIDPARGAAEKVGKYDYVVAVGKKGPQAWCALSASPLVNDGEAKDILVSAKRQDGSGNITYEVGIPWSRLAPFTPAPGADLGLTMALNEDDGAGRKSFMTWFGNAHTKDVDTVGDLILE